MKTTTPTCQLNLEKECEKYVSFLKSSNFNNLGSRHDRAKTGKLYAKAVILVQQVFQKGISGVIFHQIET